MARKKKGRMPAALARYWASRRGGGSRKRSGGSRRSSGRTTIVLAGSGVGKRRRGGKRRGFAGGRGFALIPSTGTMKQLAIAGGLGVAGFIGVEKLTTKLIDRHELNNPGTELPFYLKPGWGRAAVKAVLGGVIVTAGSRYLGRDKAWGLAAGVLLSAGLDAYDAYNKVENRTRIDGSAQGSIGAGGYTNYQLPEASEVEQFDARRLAMTA